MYMYSLKSHEKFIIFRLRAGLSKKELAERVGVSPATISKYEKGLSFPNDEMLQNLSMALGVSINMLLYGFDDPAKNMPKEPLIKQNPPA